MDWSIRMKLKYNWKKFSQLLLSTGDKQIIEESHKDRFWGCVENKEEILVGTNVLGQLLMKLREEIKREINKEDNIQMKEVRELKLFGQTMEQLFKQQM